MKKFLILLHVSSIFSLHSFTQGLGIGTQTPDASSILDIKSNTKGLLIPRMSTRDIDLIPNPAKWLMIFDTTKNELRINMGTTTAPDWRPTSTYSAWGLHGNIGANGTEFLGTIYPFLVKIGGYQAAYIGNNIGSSTFLGYRSGEKNTATYNLGIGPETLWNNIDGTGNTSVGANSSTLLSHGSYNVMLGYLTGSEWDYGSHNTLIGTYAEGAVSGASYCIALGDNAHAQFDNQAVIGNSSTTWIGGYVGWSTVSDGRYKKNVQENVKGIDFIMKLRPVTYQLDVNGLSTFLREKRGNAPDAAMQKAIQEKEQMRFSGFIAQEVEASAKETQYDFGGVHIPANSNDLYSLRYADFVVPIIKAMQEQQQIIVEQKQMILDLQKRLELLEAKLK